MKVIDQRNAEKSVLLKNLPEGTVFVYDDNYIISYYVKGKVLPSGEEWVLDIVSGRLYKVNNPNTSVTALPNAELVIKE